MGLDLKKMDKFYKGLLTEKKNIFTDFQSK